MAEETQQAVIEDNGETGWETPPDGREDDEKVGPAGEAIVAERNAYVSGLERSHAALESKLRYHENQQVAQANVTEAVRIVVELNATILGDLEAALELVDELTTRLATSRANEAFTESELLRMQARSFDVTEALQAGNVTVKVICTKCGRKEAENG